MTPAETLAIKLLRDGWPKSKEAATALKAETEAAQAAEANDKRLASIDAICTEMRFLVRAKHNDRQWDLIRDVVKRLNAVVET